MPRRLFCFEGGDKNVWSVIGTQSQKEAANAQRSTPNVQHPIGIGANHNFIYSPVERKAAIRVFFGIGTRNIHKLKSLRRRPDRCRSDVAGNRVRRRGTICNRSLPG